MVYTRPSLGNTDHCSVPRHSFIGPVFFRAGAHHNMPAVPGSFQESFQGTPRRGLSQFLSSSPTFHIPLFTFHVSRFTIHDSRFTIHVPLFRASRSHASRSHASRSPVSRSHVSRSNDLLPCHFATFLHVTDHSHVSRSHVHTFFSLSSTFFCLETNTVHLNTRTRIWIFNDTVLSLV